MSKKTEGTKATRSLFLLRNYLIFFLLISFVVTCCFLLFLKFIDVTIVDVKKSAIVTFGNVIFLSLLCTVIDGIRRKITVERPVKRILKATQRLTNGDFTTRINIPHDFKFFNELDIIAEDFNKMAKELSGIETLRTDFITNVSHEIKTPLAVIQNAATMLQRVELSQEEQNEYAKSISNASLRLSELITNILKLNKLENQQIYPEAKTYNVGEQIRECLLTFETIWETKNLQLEIDIDDLFIAADEELLTYAWSNLFSNAVKFTPPNGRVAVSLKQQDNQAVLTVTDTGCGISTDVGEHVFEKFYQGDGAHATQGNGLGLALVKRVVDIVGGEILVESVVGQGSSFVVKIEVDSHEST